MRLDHLLSKENGVRTGTRVRTIGVGDGCCSSLGERSRAAEVEADVGVAQLGEHLPCKQGVMGSNPIISIALA